MVGRFRKNSIGITIACEEPNYFGEAVKTSRTRGKANPTNRLTKARGDPNQYHNMSEASTKARGIKRQDDDDGASMDTLDEDLASFIFDLLSFSNESDMTPLVDDGTLTPQASNIPFSSIVVRQEIPSIPRPFIKSKRDAFQSKRVDAALDGNTTVVSLDKAQQHQLPLTPGTWYYPSQQHQQGNAGGTPLPQLEALSPPETYTQSPESTDKCPTTTKRDDDTVPGLERAMSEESVENNNILVPETKVQPVHASLSCQRRCWYDESLDYGVLLVLCIGWLAVMGSALAPTVLGPPPPLFALFFHLNAPMTRSDNLQSDVLINFTESHSLVLSSSSSSEWQPPFSARDATFLVPNTLEDKKDNFFVETAMVVRAPVLPSFLSQLNLRVGGICPLAVYA